MSGLELMLPPFVACMILVAIHSYLGLHVIAREVIFVDLSLAQMAALGTTTGLLVGVAPGSGTAQLFALAFVVLGAALFAATRTHTKGSVPQEAIIGIVYVVASAAALLVADKAPRGADAIKDVLVGTILWVTWPAIARLAAAYAILGTILFALRRRFETISFDEAEAQRKGWRLRWWDFWFYCIFGIVITFSVPLGGVLLVFSFLVVPAVTAFLFTREPVRLTIIAFSTGSIASALGLWASYQSDLPTGPTIVCSYGVVLALAGLARRVALQKASESRGADVHGELVPENKAGV
ncbi:MAG: High-affinity zinc uptake system membrane protein ZnuB [Gemmatimonadaceae bacterium]|nr:High-affinity zinc uptake system membrane protein ZnuB [Gemmatimonadaceae bacterium]